MAEQITWLREQMTPTLAALIAMSVVSLAIGIERLLWAWRFRVRLQRSRAAILDNLRRDENQGAQAVNASLPQHPASALFAWLLKAPATEPLPGARRLQMQIVRAARKRLWLLGSIGAIAPFVGLMGTVLGVMQAIAAMGAEASGGFAVVSQGISEALVTTAVGIFVAVQAVVLFNYLQTYLGDTAAELKDAVEEISEQRTGALHGASGT